MGALTLKSFPFELRGWDIEKFESIDPTDSFGTQTRVYISKNQIVQIEPDYDAQTNNTWLSDKGRQFFDEIFETCEVNEKEFFLQTNSGSALMNSLFKTLYIFDHCNRNNSKNYFFTIVFENLSIEVLSLLILIAKNYSFFKLRRAEQIKLENDLEENFQLNSSSNKIRLNSSTLCLLLATNPRYESYYLNLSLRQRMLKGNFKCFTIGSSINLTFSTSFLGSNISVVKTIAEGNNLNCQDLKNAKNPLLISNAELYKRNDGKNIIKILKTLKYCNIFSKTWNGLNILNPSLNETGIHMLSNFMPLSSKDLISFSSLYLLNVDMNNITNIKKITQLKFLKFSANNETQIKKKSLFVDQSHRINNNLGFYNKTEFDNYFYLPNSMFYENNETFVNAQGSTKRTTKLIFRKKSKNGWQILRRMVKQLKEKLIQINNKDNNHIFFNSKKIVDFKNYVSFHFNATQNITSLNFYLVTKNKSCTLFSQNILNFRQKNLKLQNTKMQYWLNDFFSGGKDNYSHNSLVMANCSKILRSENTNFF